MRERRDERFGRTAQTSDSLTITLLDVVFDRHRRWPDVTAQIHRFFAAFAADIGEAETITDFADQIAAHDFDLLFVLEELERFADDFERETEKLREISTDHRAARVECLQQHVADEGEG